jgi:hypothetical protein
MVFGGKFRRIERNELTILHTAQTGNVFGHEAFSVFLSRN